MRRREGLKNLKSLGGNVGNIIVVLQTELDTS
jgi:hypothetical protein